MCSGKGMGIPCVNGNRCVCVCMCKVYYICLALGSMID